jgi:hypothetical protein
LVHDSNCDAIVAAQRIPASQHQRSAHDPLQIWSSTLPSAETSRTCSGI